MTRTQKSFALSFISLAVLGLSACKKSDAGTDASGSGTGASGGGSAKMSPQEKEAADFAMAEIKKHVVQSGDGWLTAYNMNNQFAPNYIRQYKDLAIANVATSEIADTDKLNGFEWAGVITFKPTSAREIGDQGIVDIISNSGTIQRPNKQWSQWVQITPEEMHVEKHKGKWQTHDTMLIRGTIPTDTDRRNMGMK